MTFADSIEHLLDLLKIEKHEIGRAGPGRYLTRYVLKGSRFEDGEKLFLHIFHRSDYDEALHSHPWPYKSLIVTEGYWEHVPAPCLQTPGDLCVLDQSRLESSGEPRCRSCGETMGRTVETWYPPGSLLERPANWFHRVEIKPNTQVVTMLWIGLKEQSWGYACPKGFVPWRKFEANQEAGTTGCGDLIVPVGETP